MPPRPMLPGQPAGATDLVPYNPYATGYPGSPSASPSMAPKRDYRFAVSQNGPLFLPGDLTDDEAKQAVQAYDQYIARLTQAWQESSGLQRKQIEAQIDDAKKARENALAIAQMQDATSRYGTDTSRDLRLAELTQNQRQFDATHALDMHRYGLDVAKAYTEYSRTPDMMFARNDFMNAMGRVGQGLGPRNVMSQGTPQAKSWQDFAALAGYSTPTVQAGQSQGGGGGMAPQGPTGGGTDQRQKAVQEVMKAMPPSDSAGNDGQDWEALNAIRSLYAARRPGSVERLGKDRQAIANAGLARMGYDPSLVNADYRRTLPGQRSVRAA